MLDFSLRVAGGAYLLWIGIKIWRAAADPVANDMPTHQGSSRRAFVRALLVQLANPKTAIFYAWMFAAMLPASPPFWMLIVLPPLLFCNEFVWYAIVAFAFSSRKPRSVYLHSKQWIDRATGAVWREAGDRRYGGCAIDNGASATGVRSINIRRSASCRKRIFGEHRRHGLFVAERRTGRPVEPAD
ncbi:LysE family transporter (plasmid) [Rhizobium sp. 007]|nr:LysE family transporter [Rhizobium sp. 007]